MSRTVSMQFGKPGGVVQDNGGGSSSGGWSLVWSNPSPTTSAASIDAQIANVSIYKEFLIYFRYNTAATYYQTYHAIGGITDECYGIVVYTYIGRRQFSLTSTGFSFLGGQRQSSYNSWTNANDYCIPVFIYAR